MANRGKNKCRAKQNQRKRLKKLLAPGKLYLNMDSKEWQTGIVDGVDVRGHCCGYRVPRGTTPEEEAAMVKKWRVVDAYPKKEVSLPAPKPPKAKKPKKQPNKKKLRLRVAEVHLELIGTEL